LDAELVVNRSAQPVQTLIENNLLYELRLMIYPVVLGAGRRVFGEPTDKKTLRLVDSKTVGDGIDSARRSPALPARERATDRRCLPSGRARDVHPARRLAPALDLRNSDAPMRPGVARILPTAAVRDQGGHSVTAVRQCRRDERPVGSNRTWSMLTRHVYPSPWVTALKAPGFAARLDGRLPAVR
jgi:hypothetical protein